MDTKQFSELILQSLEHELGGLLVYETALKCVVNDDLREEWEKYLEETRSHVEALRRSAGAWRSMHRKRPRVEASSVTSANRWSTPWKWPLLRARRRLPNWLRASVS